VAFNVQNLNIVGKAYSSLCWHHHHQYIPHESILNTQLHCNHSRPIPLSSANIPKHTHNACLSRFYHWHSQYTSLLLLKTQDQCYHDCGTSCCRYGWFRGNTLGNSSTFFQVTSSSFPNPFIFLTSHFFFLTSPLLLLFLYFILCSFFCILSSFLCSFSSDLRRFSFSLSCKAFKHSALVRTRAFFLCLQ